MRGCVLRRSNHSSARNIALTLFAVSAFWMRIAAADSLMVVFPATVMLSGPKGQPMRGGGVVEDILIGLGESAAKRRQAQAFAEFDHLLTERGLDLRPLIEAQLRCVGARPEACPTLHFVATFDEASHALETDKGAILLLRFNFDLAQGFSAVAQWIDDSSPSGMAESRWGADMWEATYHGRVPAEVQTANRRSKDNAAIREYLLGGEQPRLLDQVRESLEEIAAMQLKLRELFPVGTEDCQKPPKAQQSDPSLGPPHETRTGRRQWMLLSLPNRCRPSLASVPRL